MNKKIIYTISIIVFVAVIAFILVKYNNDLKKQQTTNYGLLERNGVLAQTDEWKKIRLQAAGYLRKIQANPQDSSSMISLVTIFIREARVTGNYAYYDMASLKYLNDILAIDANNFQALSLKSLIYLSQHHFADGLSLAKKARVINPYNSFIYGLIVDGNVEMGYYDSAVSSAQQMVNIRPDLKSYSRISYIREIYGDYPGAIKAMKMAVDAGAPGDEGTEWTKVQLGKLYENVGDTLNAEMYYTMTEDDRPNYAYGLAGLARIAAFRKDYPTAIKYYTAADSAVNDFAMKEALADVYELSGQKNKSKELMQIAIDSMNSQAQSGNNNDNIGHYVDKELAFAYLKTGDYDKALEHALLEYNRRPDNIDVNDAVAWVYYNKGDYAKALPYIKTALKTNSKNPTLLCHAALIFEKNGDKVSAKNDFISALNSNPVMDATLKAASTSVMQSL